MLPLLEIPTTTTSSTSSANNPRINEQPTTSFRHPTAPFSDDFDFDLDLDIDSSTCSTPFVSAPSSPGRNNAPFPLAGGGGFYYSAPTSPMHFILTTTSKKSSVPESSPATSTCSFEFDFSARLSTNGTASAGSMSSADELFLNGQIRPMKLSTHLQRPQMLAPLLDLDESEEQQLDDEVERGRASKFRDKSLRRRTRSMSPLRAFSSFDWSDDLEMKSEKNEEKMKHIKGKEQEQEQEDSESIETTTNPSDSGASSRSSSAGRSSKRWVFLKEFLNRSKSEGRSNGQNKFWGSLSFSPIKEKIKTEKFLSTRIPLNSCNKNSAMKGMSSNNNGKAIVNGLGKRRAAAPSAHELHYTAKRAEAEEMRKKTYLPYKQGLLGCLGFNSKSYGRMHGFARAFNSVSSR